MQAIRKMNARHAAATADAGSAGSSGGGVGGGGGGGGGGRRALVLDDFVDPSALLNPLDLLRELEPGPFVEQLSRVGASSKQRAREGRPKPKRLDNYVFTGASGTGSFVGRVCRRRRRQL